MANKVAVYLRVSTDQQSTDLQRSEILRFIQARGWILIEIYEDHLSGATVKRPGLQKMLQSAREGRFNIIVTYRLDRFFRSLRDLLSTLHQLDEWRIDFVSIKDNLDFTSSAGRLMVHLLGAIAQFERELTHSRVLAGLENAKRKGIRLGRPTTVPADEIRILRNRGLSLSAIAKRVGCSKSGVHKSLSQESSSNTSIMVENTSFQDLDFSGHKTIDFETSQILPVSAVQCHQQEISCHERDSSVIDDTEGSSKC